MLNSGLLRDFAKYAPGYRAGLRANPSRTAMDHGSQLMRAYDANSMFNNGGVAMDAITVDITDIPQAQMWDEAVIMGRQGNAEISVHAIAKLKNTVSYDVLTNWQLRLRRKAVGTTRTTGGHIDPHWQTAGSFTANS